MKEYDLFELLEDINPRVKKGTIGTILEIYDNKNIEVEFVDEKGKNITWGNKITFTISKDKIKLI